MTKFLHKCFIVFISVLNIYCTKKKILSKLTFIYYKKNLSNKKKSFKLISPIEDRRIWPETLSCPDMVMSARPHESTIRWSKLGHTGGREN